LRSFIKIELWTLFESHFENKKNPAMNYQWTFTEWLPEFLLVHSG